MVSTCPTCQGAGQVITDPCRKCRGTGLIPKKRTLSVKIPAGVHEGQGIRVSGEGEPASTADRAAICIAMSASRRIHS